MYIYPLKIKNIVLYCIEYFKIEVFYARHILQYDLSWNENCFKNNFKVFILLWYWKNMN